LVAAILALAAGAGLVWRSWPRIHREAGLDVLLVTVDTLRADAVGAYGNAGAQTPWIDRLAAAGVRFDFAHAQSVVTLPSHANILSGRYPPDHGVRDNSGFRFPKGVDTLATLLKARGYRTGAFVSAFTLDARFGLGRGFDVYDDALSGATARPAFLVQERSGSATVARARAWLTAADGPSFAWVHIYEPHFPYAPPEPFASRFAGDPYRGEVAAADAALGPLLEPLLAAGDAGRTLVVLTADHGEALGEHGEATHGIFAYEATLRVPLILYQPRLFRPRVVSSLARHVDLLPTILDALALPPPPRLPGRSLLAVASGGASALPATSYFEALSGQLNRGWAPLTGVVRDREKYVDLPIPELYDLRKDSQEARNLAGSPDARLDEMRGALAAFRSGFPPLARAPEGRETRERLRGLGYVAGAGPLKERYTEADDPKRLMALDAMLQEVEGFYVAGDLPAALERCRALVARRPEMAISLLYLAHLERESGDLNAGVAALRKAVALSPEDTTAAALLGGYLTQAGRPQEATGLLEPYARQPEPDVDVLVAHALALASLGRSQDALASLARARQIVPANAMLLVDVGTVRLMGGDRKAAREAFEAALKKDPNVARAWSSLGVLAAEDGRAEEATERLKQAIALDPRECDKLLAIASLLSRRGRAAEARGYLELFLASAPASLYSHELERARATLAANRP
jgi:arylsulfatase A-like enzyme/Tfp pilus assembly protein PilF